MRSPACAVHCSRKGRLHWFLVVLSLAVFTVSSCGGGGGGGGGNPSPAGPPAPTAVSATAGIAMATINWSGVSGATSYNIYYSTSPGVSKSTAGTKYTGVTRPQDVTGLSNGTTYYFVVTAVNGDGESVESSEVSATPTPNPPPAAPTGVTASPGSGAAIIGWSAVSGATSYNIYFLTTTGVTKFSGIVVLGVTSPQLVTGLTNGTTYYFVVTAVNANGESVESSEVSATPVPNPPPPAPTGVAALAGPGRATISWSAVSGATSYNVYYSQTAGVTKLTGTKLAGVVSPLVIAGLTNGTTYYFVVTAVNANGESVESSEVFATPVPNPPPPAPTGVAALAGPGRVTVIWSAVTGATSYNMYYSQTAGVTKLTGTKLSGVTSPLVVAGLTNGTTYYFVVTAVNADGESAESSEASATPFEEYIAIGDSITAGEGDDLPSDDTSLDGRNSGGGFEPVLNDQLTAAKGIPHNIVNEGVGGITSFQGLALLPGILTAYPNAKYYLILFGTNDADPTAPTPSGMGLVPGDPGYSDSYKDYMQQIIDAIVSAGKIPYLAKVPFTLDGDRIPKIQEYNQVIGELMTANGITVVPPDFYAWFQANQGELADLLHPNGQGYRSMAIMWKDALAP